MAALTAVRSTPHINEGADTVNTGADDVIQYPVGAAAKIYQGALVVLQSGYAVPGTAATGLTVLGRAQQTVDNTSGAAAALNVKVRRGVFRWDNSTAGDKILAANVGGLCYVVDDHTVALTSNSSARSVAGMVVRLDATGVWVHSDPLAMVGPLYVDGGVDGSFITPTSSSNLTNKTLTAPVMAGGLTASGSAANDYSGSTGDFKLSTGAATWAGASGKALSLTSTAAGITIQSTTSGTVAVDSAAALNLGATNATAVVLGNASGTLALASTKYALSTGGIVTKYNNEAVAGIGQSYIEAVAQDVASLAGSTTILTYATPATGLYRVTIVVSAHTNTDTVTATVTYTDAVEGFATTLTPISAVALTHDSNTGTTSASVIVRASAATNLVATATVTGQTTTKFSALVERLN